MLTAPQAQFLQYHRNVLCMEWEVLHECLLGKYSIMFSFSNICEHLGLSYILINSLGQGLHVVYQVPLSKQISTPRKCLRLNEYTKGHGHARHEGLHC